MIKIILIFLLITIKSFLYDETNAIPTEFENNITIDPGHSKTYNIKYFQTTILKFGNIDNETKNAFLRLNIHSINCNIEVYNNLDPVTKINLNSYSILVNLTDDNITIEPTPDKIDGEYKENYKEKNCYLSINSYFLTNEQPNLKIENKEENIFYLEHSRYSSFQASYELVNILTDSFITLNFQIEESNFEVNINVDNKKENPIVKQINNSRNIYLNSEFLLNNKPQDTNDEKRILNINFSKYDKSIIIRFKIIEKNTICLLEKNTLTFGFLTKKTNYQYYYAEVFKGEEGELMLHNKRFYGELWKNY